MPDEGTWTFTHRAREALRELDENTQRRIIARFDGDELGVYVGTVGHRPSVYDEFP